jgi:hypothetical protein
MNFQGCKSIHVYVTFTLFFSVCNKGIRDAHGRHFNLKERNCVGELGQRSKKHEPVEITKGHEEVAEASLSDTSTEVEKGSHQQKRRRLSCVRPDSLDIESGNFFFLVTFKHSYYTAIVFRSVHGNWETILTFFQDPALVICFIYCIYYFSLIFFFT